MKQLEKLRLVKDDVILDFNNGLLKIDIARKYNVSIDNLLKFTKEIGISFNERRKIVNWNPFEDLSDPEVMYWLGFIAADGAIFEDRITLQLAIVDYEVMVKYHKFLKEKPTLRNITWKLGEKRYPGCAISFRNKEVVSFLDEIGITKRKSLTIEPKFKINSDFLRGYIDGDGCIETKTIEDRSFGRIRIGTASPMMASSIIRFYLENDIYFRYYRDASVNRKSNLHEIVVSKHEDILKLMNMLYNNADIYLERKYQKAVQIRNILENNTLNSGNQR